MTTQAESVKDALSSLPSDAVLHDLPDTEFVTGGAITNAFRAAGYDESGRVCVNNFSAWSWTVAKLEKKLSEDESEYEITESNYVLIQGTEGNYELLVWECEADSVGDDGANAIYRIPLCEIDNELRARADIDNTL